MLNQKWNRFDMDDRGVVCRKIVPSVGQTCFQIVMPSDNMGLLGIDGVMDLIRSMFTG